MHYVPEHFASHELLPQDVHLAVLGRGVDPFQLLDNRLLVAADRLRRRYGPMTANNWLWGGEDQYRGFRPESCPVGSVLSQHRFGRALDLVPWRVEAEAIREDMRKHPHLLAFVGIRGVENGVAWLHIDVGNRPGEGIRFFNP